MDKCKYIQLTLKVLGILDLLRLETKVLPFKHLYNIIIKSRYLKYFLVML